MYVPTTDIWLSNKPHLINSTCGHRWYLQITKKIKLCTWLNGGTDKRRNAYCTWWERFISSDLCTGQKYFEMAPQRAKQKDKKHSLRDLRRSKKEKKNWKEEKLLKVRNIGYTSPNCYDENTEKEIPKVCTLSIAVPGSILDNAQSPELRTYLAGQIARAACVFKIDEVSTFNLIFQGRKWMFCWGFVRTSNYPFPQYPLRSRESEQIFFISGGQWIPFCVWCSEIRHYACYFPTISRPNDTILKCDFRIWQ